VVERTALATILPAVDTMIIGLEKITLVAYAQDPLHAEDFLVEC